MLNPPQAAILMASELIKELDMAEELIEEN
jgi:hypothetical protein